MTGDAARVSAVQWTGLLDTGPEEAFDRLTRLASALTGASMVSVTLVDQQHSHTKSLTSIDGPDTPLTPLASLPSVPVEDSLCQHVLEAQAAVVVEDVAARPELASAWAEQLGITAWAAVPILSPQRQVLGSFCAMDTTTRTWSTADLEALGTLAQAAAGEIGLRVALRSAQLAYADAERHAQAAERSAEHAQHMAEEAVELAQTLQESLLPSSAPRIPGLELAARYRPGGQGADVLGDFYDVFPIPGGWGVAIGDVCGKGAWAARTTALARSTLRAVGHTDGDPETVLNTLNEVLHVWFAERRSFVTATYATMTACDGGLAVHVANGGHPPAFLLRADGEVRQFSDGGRALGLRAEAHIGLEHAQLHPGDALVFYTDGVTESRRGPRGAQFDESGIAQTLAGLRPGASAENIADAVSQATLEHAGGAVPDDTAIVVVRSP